ncbi:MAG: metallophosphoesterase [Treponema sp.]|nr:metallophosphoesterase [Treponema sp.]
MVKYFFHALFLSVVFFLCGCTVDLLGLFGSTDLNDRLAERDTFNFLTDDMRNISLGDEYSFIVLADTHIEDGNAHGLENLKNVIDSNEIKFVVITGDITQYGSAHDIQKFIDIAASFEVPCYPVIGNHDVYFGNWPEWKRLIGSTNFRINGGGTTLLIMDSANAYFGNGQISWLQRELENASGRVFVFSHANLFVNNLTEFQHFTDTRERARVMSLLRNKCDIMFMGHSHEGSVNEAGNVMYVVLDDYIADKVYCIVSVNTAGISCEFRKL